MISSLPGNRDNEYLNFLSGTKQGLFVDNWNWRGLRKIVDSMLFIIPNAMDMLAVSTLFIEFFSDIEVGVLRRLDSVWEDFESESTKIFHIHTLYFVKKMMIYWGDTVVDLWMCTLPSIIFSRMYSPVALKMIWNYF